MAGNSSYGVLHALQFVLVLWKTERSISTGSNTPYATSTVKNRGDADSLVPNLLDNDVRLLFCHKLHGDIWYFTYTKNLLLFDNKLSSCDVENFEKDRMTADHIQGKETDEGSIIISTYGHGPTMACRSLINRSVMDFKYIALLTADWEFI